MKTAKKVLAVIAVIASVILLTSCTSCASCARFQKNMDSEFGGGLPREVIVYSATGAEIWRFSGKFDISYTNDRILFDDENGKRHTIYSWNGTVIVNEI